MSASLDKSLGNFSDNAASTTLALTTSGAAVSGTRLYAAMMWAGTPTLASFAGGGLTWVIDGQKQSGGFNIGVVSADCPAGLASATVLTGTFSASATHGLIAASSFIGVANLSPIEVDLFGTVGGAAVAHWGPYAGMGANDEGAFAYFATCTDNTGTSAPSGNASELHDFSNASFFGALTVQYQILAPNELAWADGTWSTVSGSLSNNGIAVVRKDISGIQTVQSRGKQRPSRMRVF